MIQWKESPTHATSSCGCFSVWKWGDQWVSEVWGKAWTHKTKQEAKSYCEAEKRKRIQ